MCDQSFVIGLIAKAMFGWDFDLCVAMVDIDGISNKISSSLWC